MLRIEPAHAQHNSNEFGSALAQLQPSPPTPKELHH